MNHSKGRWISNRAATLAVMAWLLSGAGCQSGTNDHMGLSALGGIGAGGVARAFGADDETATWIGIGATAATAISVHIMEQRQADRAEREAAEARAAEELARADADDRDRLRESGTYVAVRVPARPAAPSDRSEVMVVDPSTGRTVDDTVYVIDRSATPVTGGDKIELGEYEAIYVD